MESFILRVQLANEDTRLYTLLRDRLLGIGFTKRIKNKDGVEYRLPNGNYYIESSSSEQTIFDAAHRIAAGVTTNPMVLLVKVSKQSPGMLWAGLERC